MSEYSVRANELMEEFPGKVHVLPMGNSLLAAHTKLRASSTSSEAFIHLTHRISTRVLDHALDLVSYSSKTVETPTGELFHGVETTSRICGVSILRAASSMESSLRSLVRNAPIGKLLIQRDESTEDKRAVLIYSKLPKTISECFVVLLDPMLATGGSALAAIKTLNEAGVSDDRIIFANIVAAPEGVRAIATKTGVTIVTSMVDSHLNADKYIIPGLGDFGDRYYCSNE